jgi:hypothetical protein
MAGTPTWCEPAVTELCDFRQWHGPEYYEYFNRRALTPQLLYAYTDRAEP